MMDDLQIVVREIKYELAKGEHTFTMCKCGRHGTRTNLCWECLLESLIILKTERGRSEK
jgi:hypothetical protein